MRPGLSRCDEAGIASGALLDTSKPDDSRAVGAQVLHPIVAGHWDTCHIDQRFLSVYGRGSGPEVRNDKQDRDKTESGKDQAFHGRDDITTEGTINLWGG